MSTSDASKTNRNPRITSSPASPLTFSGRPQLWVQAEGAGTITLTDESGTQVAIPFVDREALMGPWLSLVSFTGCTAVRFGDGKIPAAPTAGPATQFVQDAGTMTAGTITLATGITVTAQSKFIAIRNLPDTTAAHWGKLTTSAPVVGPPGTGSITISSGSATDVSSVSLIIYG